MREEPTKEVVDYIVGTLMELADMFMDAYYAKKYASAKYIYDTVCRIAEVMYTPEDVKKQLFGDWEDEECEISEGLFPRDFVSKAYEECCIKSYKDFEHESYRRFGQPPQYYPAPRYPVPGYEKTK